MILFAFLHRESLGLSDGMGNIFDQNFNVDRFIPGTREDNFYFDNEVLLQIYTDLKNNNPYDKKIPLPKHLYKILQLQMSFCYFDKTPLSGNGSICSLCAKELLND